MSLDFIKSLVRHGIKVINCDSLERISLRIMNAVTVFHVKIFWHHDIDYFRT